MKCQCCGGNLNIEDKFCPQCGILNPFAVKHQEEMERYEHDYRQTKEDMLKRSSIYNRRNLKITIIAVLITLIVACAFVFQSADDIRWSMKEKSIASNAETDLRPDAQSWNHRFVLVVLSPLAEIDVEQQRHINIMRLFQVADGVVVFANPLFRACALPRINDVDFGSEDGMFGDEGDAHAASEVRAKLCAIVPADFHGGKRRANHQAAADALGKHLIRSEKHDYEQDKMCFVFHIQLFFRSIVI